MIKKLAPSALAVMLVGCTVTSNSTQEGSIERPQAAPAAVKTLDWFCARLPISTHLQGENLTLYVRDKTYTLTPMQAASGARFQGENGQVEVWQKGTEATVILNGQTLPTCYQQGTLPKQFSARGNEPFWQFALDGDSLTMRTPNGEAVGRFTVTRDFRIQHTLAASTSLGAVRAQVVKRTCTDTMTGLPYPYEVSGTLGAQAIAGCGGLPEDVLQGAEWHVDAINGESVGSQIITLTFLPNGRLTGSTGCNRYFGQYQLSGEGISISQLGMTRMACAPEVARFEQRFTQQLRRVNQFTVDAVGALELHSTDGKIRAFAL
ncbi:MAG: Heat shock protein [Idiomarinaceae bacterium HL-53]|nr:MAG: Heat shock protein [Idiomarinaceae bacterium HL-53]